MQTQTSLPSPQTTLVVLLGAKEWPYAPAFNESNESEAFANSANALSDYFLDPHKFNLPEENLLNLFNSDKSSDDIDSEIGQFLHKRVEELEKSGSPARDVLVYFVGHGGFAGSGFDYFLATRRTRAKNPDVSSIRIVTLARTLREEARYIRRIVILDCCFAASASGPFQSEQAQAQAAVRQTVDAFKTPGKGAGVPGKGTSLLCSSGHNIPSLISPKREYTMFSEALLYALQQENSYQQEGLSLRLISHLTQDYLRREYRDKAPNPEVHSPDQSEGDVADVPFFTTQVKKKTIHVPVIGVLGAKGGVGKGLFVSCASQLIADGGHEVAVIDLDLSTCGSTKFAKKFYPMTTSRQVKTVFDHLAPHAVGFRRYEGSIDPGLWDITPPYLNKRKRGNIYLLPAREDYLHGSAYAVVANIPDTTQKSREAKLVELIQEMLERIKQEYPQIQCILIDCGAEAINPIYSAAFACADYRYILTLPDDTYFDNVIQIQRAYWQRYKEPNRQGIFVVANRVISAEDDIKLLSRFQHRGYKGYIPLNRDLEKDVFAGGSVDYDLGYNDIFMAVRNSLPEELKQGDRPLVPDAVKVRMIPWFSRFVEDKLAERILRSQNFFWRTWLIRGFAAVSIISFIALITNLVWRIVSSSSSTHYQLDLVPLFVSAALVAASIPLLLRQEKKRRLLSRIAHLETGQYQVLKILVYERIDQRLFRWLNELLVAKQHDETVSRRLEIPLPE